jgi:hypothetical protein
MSIDEILDQLRTRSDCVFGPPAGIPVCKDGHRVSDDVREFYSRTGGGQLFVGSPFPIELRHPSLVSHANTEMIAEEVPEDLTFSWYIVGGYKQDLVSVDFGVPRNGWCYDSFWDRHIGGNSAVIAYSFAEFLERCTQARGRERYWTAPEFTPWQHSRE